MMIAVTMEEINKLIFVKRYEEAFSILDQLLSQEVAYEDLLIHIRRIELAVKIGRIDEIYSRYEARLQRVEPSLCDVVAKIYLELFTERSTAEKATADLRDAMQKFGAHAGLFYGLAYAAEALGQIDRAAQYYEECIKHGAHWYPAYFGLSQLKYHLKDDKSGDQYFYAFEKQAPYNVYGNFETHRKLALEFLALSRFREAKSAIKTLSEWWLENRHVCPPEIQLYEFLLVAKISAEEGNLTESEGFRAKAISMLDVVLEDDNSQESVLFFCAKAFEEHGENTQALRCYKKVLTLNVAKPELVQKIGTQFFALGDYKTAHELFTEAYQFHADNSEIRFCLLVARLKLAGVDVDEYLSSRERMRSLTSDQGDRVELLSVLHSLAARYKDDAEVQAQLGDVYQHLGNLTRAERHFRHMLQCDPKSKLTRLRFAQFAAKNGLIADTKSILTELSHEQLDSATWQEVQWLNAVIATIGKDHTSAVQYIETILQVDPWNVTYLVLYCLNQAIVHDPNYEAESHDNVIFKLHIGIEQNLDWVDYDTVTKKFLNLNHHSLSYQREKLKFLYFDGQKESLKAVLSIATKFNPTRGYCDLLKLLNTNYDSPSIYLGLGTLQKELWQLEAASTWFEATIALPKVSNGDKATAQMELADCYIWRNVNLNKATELAKLSMELDDKEQDRASLILLHAHLKAGQIREAKTYLSRLEIQGASDPEFLFLKGLLAYRNGVVTEAKGIWKSLLIHRTETIRFHHIKTEMMKFYYDGAPYLETHLSM